VTAELADEAKRPRSMTVHYLRPPEDGPADLEVTVERAGRTMSTASVRLVQGGRTAALALVSAGSSRNGLELDEATMPEVPDPEDCPPLAQPTFAIPIRDNFDCRHALGPQAFSDGDEAVTGGWLRLRDPEPTDAHVLVQVADAWVPALFSVTSSRTGVPTIDLTVHFRQLPQGEDPWLLVRFRTRLAAEGFLEEDGEIWDRSGRLLAQSRQLAVLV
jgi:acyl-CoA thioesterase